MEKTWWARSLDCFAGGVAGVRPGAGNQDGGANRPWLWSVPVQRGAAVNPAPADDGQIQQLSFTLLLLLLALLYPIALTATSLSLSLPSPHTHTALPACQWARGGEVASFFQLQKEKEWQGAAAPLLNTSRASWGGSRGWAPLRLCAYYWNRPQTPPRKRLVCYWQPHTHKQTG